VPEDRYTASGVVEQPVGRVWRQFYYRSSPTEQTNNDPLLAAKIERAKMVGLEDGTRIEARGDGWVVIDSFYSYLVDPEDAAWVAGDDDEEMPPAVFPSAEAAYRARERSEETSAARKGRREEALKRLGRNESP
jgi:hypothetical protein